MVLGGSRPRLYKAYGEQKDSGNCEYSNETAHQGTSGQGDTIPTAPFIYYEIKQDLVPSLDLDRDLAGLFQISQHLLGMAVGLDVFKNVLNPAIRTNHESCPRHTPDFLSIHVLFFHDTESLGDFLVAIGQQGKGQILFLLKLLLRFRGIRGDPKQHGTGLLHLFVCVAEPASFNGSAGSVGAGIEKENHSFALQVFQCNFFSVLVLQSKVGSLIIDLHANVSGIKDV